MTALGPPLDVVTRVTPLGIRLWDFVTQTAVSEGLALSVRGPAGPASVSIAINPSNVFVVSRLPGLAATEAGDGEAAFWASPPAAASYVITVDDSLGRFLPCSVQVIAPTHGVLPSPCAAGTWMPSMALGPAIPLFSSPSRELLPGTAAVRAQIWDAVADAPAAYAMLEVDTGAPPAQRGLADDQGRVLVALPYPPLPTTLSSPPGPQALTALTWPVTPTVYYDTTAAATGTSGHPDLCSLLAQAPATALATASPPSTLSTATLAYGSDLVLATPGQSTLLIDPGAAP